MRIRAAVFHYFSVIFALGFVLGAIRVIFIVPHTGALVGVLLELPLMIAASWHAAAFAIRRYAIPPETAPRFLMGMAAFVLLMAAETALGQAIGRTLASQYSELGTLPGQLGLAGQILFGLMPLLQLVHQERR